MKIVQFKDKKGEEICPVTSNVIWKELPLGEFVKGLPRGTGGINNDNNSHGAVITRDVIMLPYANPTLKCKASGNITVCVFLNVTDKDALMKYPTESYAAIDEFTFHDGDETSLEPPEGAKFSYVTCRVMLYSGDENHPIEPSDAYNWLANGELALYYKSNTMSIIERNQDIEPVVRSLSTHFKNGMDVKERKLHALPLFVHGSDFHSDKIRFMNFLDYADYIGADGAFATGDFVFATGQDGMNYIETVATQHTTPIYPCCGNHDRCTYSTDDFYYSVLDALKGKVTDIADGQTYYYNDLAKWKLRIIVLNQYINDGSNNISIYLGEAQKKWFINALLTIPSNFGVIILDHAPCRAVDRVEGSDEFYHYAIDETDIDFDAPYEIIDAFIAKKSVSGTWSDKSGKYAYSADFTKLQSGVEFIAWVNGHEHRDMIGYVHGTTQKQLCLNVNCANALMETNGSDLGRDGDGKSQDCFNVYSIDREKGIVKVARVGANVNCDMQDVKYMTIPYK